MRVLLPVVLLTFLLAGCAAPEAPDEPELFVACPYWLAGPEIVVDGALALPELPASLDGFPLDQIAFDGSTAGDAQRIRFLVNGTQQSFLVPGVNPERVPFIAPGQATFSVNLANPAGDVVDASTARFEVVGGNASWNGTLTPGYRVCGLQS